MGGQPGMKDVVRRRASFAQTARAVLWSFFGVRKRVHYEEDAAKLNPVHVIVMGIVGAALFVAALLSIIKFVVLR
jgi:preprotein translocase subunit Sec61beta